MTNINNPNDNISKIILDLETSGLAIHNPPIRYDKNGLRKLMAIDELTASLSHIDITQIGWMNKLGNAVHRSVAVNSKSYIRPSNIVQDSIRTNTAIRLNSTDNIKGTSRIVNTLNRDDVYNVIFNEGSKGTERYKTEQVQRSIPKHESYFEVNTPDNRRIFAAKQPLKYMHSHGELLATEQDIISGNTFIARKLTDKGIDYKGVNQSVFKGKSEGSLYGIVENLFMKDIRNGKTVSFQGWNPYFDLEVMRGALKKFGHIDLLNELDRAYYDGLLNIEGLDKVWKAITYKLAKENPTLAKDFLIHINPEAVAATGRAGKIAQTAKEWEYAVPWSAETVGNLLSYSDKVKNAMKEGVELHAAGGDVILEKAIAEETSGIYSDIIAEIGKTGTNIKSIEELLAYNSDNPRFFTEIFNRRISSASRSGAENAVSNASELMTRLSREALKKNEYIRKRTIDEVVAITVKNTRSRMYRHSMIAGLLTAMMMATYGLHEEEKNIDPSNANLSKSMLFGKRKPFSRLSTSFENNPNDTGDTLKLLMYGIGIPTATLYGVGLHQAFIKPKLFGRTVRLPSSLGDGVKEFFKTINFGAKFLETSLPTLRVFRISSTLDYLMGRSNLLYDDETKSIKKAIRFESYSGGKIKSFNDVTGRGKHFTDAYNKHGVYNDIFLERARETLDKNQYDILSDMFNPTKVKDKSNKVIVKLANSKTGSVVVAQELDEFGQVVLDSIYNRQNVIRLPFQIINAPVRQVNIRGISSSTRSALEDKYIVNSMVHHRLQSELVNRRQAMKLTQEEYLVSKGIPVAEIQKGSSRVYLNKLRYLLELDKKSVGEFGNNIYPDLPNIGRGIKTVIIPKDRKQFYSFLSEAWSESTIRGMNTFLESPLSILGVTPEHLDNLAKSWSKSEYAGTRLLGKGAKFLSRTHLGLVDYDLGRFAFPKYIGKFAAKRILPAWLGWQAFKVTDHILGAMTFSDGAGPITTAAIKAYQLGSLAYSKLSDITGFTYLSKKQERIAPGSTGLGFFVPALSAVGLYQTGELFYKYGSASFKEKIGQLGSKISENGIIKRALAPEIYRGALTKSPMQRLFSLAISNPKKAIFASMMLPMIPFVPGLLGSSKSYAERKAEYDGRKDVAVRKYRGWILSSSPFSGGKVTHYRRHITNLIQSDWENKGVIWPNYFSRAAHSLTGGLYGRYMLEDYHSKDQPVYQSSPYGANILFIGPMIAGTIGRIIKPTVTYNDINSNESIGINPYSSGISIPNNRTYTNSQIRDTIGVTSEGSNYRLYNKFANQFRDLIGFRGFAFETARNTLTGKSSAEEYTPYAQDATEMYNPAQSMWQYQLGDVTAVGGEFLRRLFVYPERLWKVNNIPNELYGVSWIPQTDETNTYKKFGRDLTHGTTFDKVNMGWLYGSRKGWEFLYPGMKGRDLEEYSSPVKLEVLQSIAPFSKEFGKESQNVMSMALSNKLTPYQEQRYYETLEQVKQVKDQIRAHAAEYTYQVSTFASRGIVTSIDDSGEFTLDTFGEKRFKLAGLSLREEDIRQNLLNRNKYNNTKDLDEETKEIQRRASNIINSKMQIGSSISIEMPKYNQMSGNNSTEAIVGSLNEDLIEEGAPRANTGNIARFNMQQNTAGFGSSILANYWNMLVPEEAWASTKLIPNKDYLDNYLYTQVFNREVKLWQHPIEQIIKPFIATELHRFAGINWIPSFTKQRRKDQEYWDIIKYIKYKVLEAQASESGDEGLAYQYHNMWRSTMIGADPTDDNTKDEMAALPQNERAYFSRFANEPDPKKRGKIYKYLPNSAKRIYSGIWAKQEALSPNAPQEVIDRYNKLQESEGWDITEDEYKKYLDDTNGETSLGDYIRAKYISEFAKVNAIPDINNPVWSENVNIENVELLTLREGGRNIEDYGFFENKARIAAFDRPAVAASIDINNINSTTAQTVGTILPYLTSSTGLHSNFSMPTSSINPISHNNIQTDEHDNIVKRNTHIIPALADDIFLSFSRLL